MPLYGAQDRDRIVLPQQQHDDQHVATISSACGKLKQQMTSLYCPNQADSGYQFRGISWRQIPDVNYQFIMWQVAAAKRLPSTALIRQIQGISYQNFRSTAGKRTSTQNQSSLALIIQYHDGCWFYHKTARWQPSKLNRRITVLNTAVGWQLLTANQHNDPSHTIFCRNTTAGIGLAEWNHSESKSSAELQPSTYSSAAQ